MLVFWCLSSFDGLWYRRFHWPAPQQVQSPMGIVALRIIQSIVRAARLGARVRRRRDQEASGEHVLQLPAADGRVVDFGGVEYLVHDVAAPERDDLARFVESIFGALDPHVSP